MPVINGNGRDVIKVNGHAIAYQGIAHVRSGMATEAAVEKTKKNGLDEYYINVEDEQGRTQRLLIYGDQLDFSFVNQRQQPTITVNGREAKLIAYDDEETSFARGVFWGARKGVTDAIDSMMGIAKRFIDNVGLAAGGAMAGTAALLLVAKSSTMGAGLGAVLGAAAGPISMWTVGLSAASLAAIALLGAVRGGMSAIQNRPNMATIAEVIEESVNLRPQRPSGQSPVAQQPPVPQAPVQRAPIAPEPPVRSNPETGGGGAGFTFRKLS